MPGCASAGEVAERREGRGLGSKPMVASDTGGDSELLAHAVYARVCDSHDHVRLL